jgi:hypothetical protein
LADVEVIGVVTHFDKICESKENLCPAYSIEVGTITSEEHGICLASRMLETLLAQEKYFVHAIGLKRRWSDFVHKV